MITRGLKLDTNIEQYLLKYAKQYSVLYAEDTESSRELMKDILSVFFDKVEMAKDGVEALEVYRKFTPDLVITDINMPKMGGLELIEEIQKINPEVCVIIVTGYIENENLLKSLELGIDKFLVKPLEKKQLYKMLYKSIFDLEFINQFERIEEEQELLSLVMELSPVFTVLEKDGKIKYINGSFLNFLDCKSADEFREKHKDIFSFIKDKRSDVVFNSYEDFKSHALSFEQNSYKVYLRDKNNFLHAFQLTNKFYPNINTLVSVFTDINSIDKDNKELKRLSETDPLTNTYNKYKFNLYFEKTYQKFQEKKYDNVSLAIINIDNLTQLIELYGNHAGDKVIRSLANYIKLDLQNGEFLARYSFQEFAIIYNNANLTSAFERSDRLRVSIKKQYDSKLTCSIGVAEFKLGDSTQDIIQRAQNAVLKAKKGGRNLVIASV